METTALELLEEKIRRAAGLIASLRQERGSLERRLEERETEIGQLRAELAARPAQDLGPELERLQEERREILAGIDRMLSILDAAEEEGEGEQRLLAAAEGAE